MSTIITGQTLTSAWLAAVEHLVGHGKQEFNLIVDVVDSDPEVIDQEVVAALDRLSTRTPRHTVGTVANTIFPQALADGATDRDALYRNYLRLVPRLRRLDPNNDRGLYFERLIDYHLRAEVGVPTNQVEYVIQTLRRERGLYAPRRFICEVPVYEPGRDRARGGFPCLSYVSFQMDGGRLRINAIYRNQYYIARALGNLLGLARLQRFVAEAAGLDQGSFTMITSHAELDCTSGEAAALLTACGRPPAITRRRARVADG